MIRKPGLRHVLTNQSHFRCGHIYRSYANFCMQNPVRSGIWLESERLPNTDFVTGSSWSHGFAALTKGKLHGLRVSGTLLTIKEIS